MITRTLTSLMLAGLLATASAASFAADDTDHSSAQPGANNGTAMPKDYTSPAGGNSSSNRTGANTGNGVGTGTGTNGGSSGSGTGAGGGTGAAGGGTGGSGGGTGS